MDKQKKSSLAQNVKDHLLKEILYGEYRDAMVLSSEDDLSQKFQVSRSTIRAALTSLEKERVIVRRQGAGTRINRKALTFSFDLNFIEDPHVVLRCIGYTPMRYLVSYREILASAMPEVQDLLKVDSREKLLEINKLWRADSKPVIFFKDYVPLSLIKHPYTEDDLEGSIFDFVYDHCEEVVESSADQIEAVLPNEEVYRVMGVDRNIPLLLLSETFFNEKGKPLFQGYGHFLQGVMRVTLRRKKV